MEDGARSGRHGGGYRTRLAAILAAWAFQFAPPLARAAEEASPPEETSRWLEWVCMLAFAALCCAVAFKNPKRSHQT